MTDASLPYPEIILSALRAVPRAVLKRVLDGGGVLPGEHHFFIEFDTTAEGVVMPPALKAQYPARMTIVLQHVFSDLWVEDDSFGVTLSFGGVASPLTVPFAALITFVDPSVDFALQLRPPELEGHPKVSGTRPAEKSSEESSAKSEAKPEKSSGEGQVVEVDFRKKR